MLGARNGTQIWRWQRALPTIFGAHHPAAVLTVLRVQFLFQSENHKKEANGHDGRNARWRMTDDASLLFSSSGGEQLFHENPLLFSCKSEVRR